MTSRQDKALERLRVARGELPRANIEAALRAHGYSHLSSDGEHHVWFLEGGFEVRFSVRHRKGAKSMVPKYWVREVRKALFLEE